MPAPTDRDGHLPFELSGFLILPENRAAVRAVSSLLEAVEAGTPPVSPLLLHGQPGTGKTRLVSVVLAAMAASAAGMTARCVPVRDLARPDAGQEGSGFADPDLLDCDVLLLEDVQHLPESSSDALCELLDRRSAHGHAVAVTSSVGPAGLTHLPRRLTSRLAAGLVVQLEPPGFTSRRAILAAAAGKTKLTAAALDWLASQRGGLRAALGQLKNLAAGKDPRALDPADVSEILVGAGLAPSLRSELQTIIERVCVAFDVESDELIGASRLRNVVLPRQVAMYLAREPGGLSLAQIGSVFGRDHTTVLHACRRVEAAARSDARFAATVRQLRKDLA